MDLYIFFHRSLRHARHLFASPDSRKTLGTPILTTVTRHGPMLKCQNPKRRDFKPSAISNPSISKFVRDTGLDLSVYPWATGGLGVRGRSLCSFCPLTEPVQLSLPMRQQTDMGHARRRNGCKDRPEQTCACSGSINHQRTSNSPQRLDRKCRSQLQLHKWCRVSSVCWYVIEAILSSFTNGIIVIAPSQEPFVRQSVPMCMNNRPLYSKSAAAVEHYPEASVGMCSNSNDSVTGLATGSRPLPSTESRTRAQKLHSSLGRRRHRVRRDQGRDHLLGNWFRASLAFRRFSGDHTSTCNEQGATRES